MQDGLPVASHSDDEELALTAPEAPKPSLATWQKPLRHRLFQVVGLATAAAAVAGACYYAIRPSPEAPETSDPDSLGLLPTSVHDSDLMMAYEAEQWEVRRHHTDFHRWLNESLARSIEHEPLPPGRTHAQIMDRFLMASSQESKKIVPHKVRNEIYCTMDVIQSAAALGSSVYYLYEAAASTHGNRCPPEGKNVLPCAATIAKLFISWGIVAVFLESSTFECANTINAPAACAADVTAATLSLLSWANSGINLPRFCKHETAADKVEAEIKQRLEAKLAAKKAEREEEFKEKMWVRTGLNGSALQSFVHEARAQHEELVAKHDEKVAKQFKEAECGLKIILGAGFVVRAIVEMLEMGDRCQPGATSPQAQQGCAFGVLAVVALWSKVSAVFSSTAIYCVPDGATNVAAACAGTITGMMAGTSFFSPMISAAGVHCAHLNDKPHPIEEEE